jgi:Protein of unknown function (DUF2889)
VTAVKSGNLGAEIEDSKLFSREIKVETADEGEFLHMKGTLLDRRLGEPLHGIEVEMKVRIGDGEIVEVSGSMPHRPLEECLAGLESLNELLGMQVVPGFSEMVKSSVGSSRGCTHLAALVMNMGNVSVQGRGAFLRKHFPEPEANQAMALGAQELGLIDSCVCWREDGPIIRRWRAEHPGEQT